MVTSILRALVRARLPIATMALTYAVAVGVGFAMVQAGNVFALHQRDALVAGANASDPASLALQQGNPLLAAVLDFLRNLLLGAVPSTIGGLAIVIPYAVAIYRGWVGGIVSVDSAHHSRLATPSDAIYYLVTLIPQLIPYILAVGAGINLGLAYLRPRPCYAGSRWHGMPIEALRDVARIYVLIVPLFLIASLWEFLFPQ
jgi:Stage II sporulation protein M